MYRIRKNTVGVDDHIDPCRSYGICEKLKTAGINIIKGLETMKRTISIVICLFMMMCLFSGCFFDIAGHETYTSTEDYQKAFDLPEIRSEEAREMLFPKSVSNLVVETFYFEWELGIVGSADVEMLLTVKYDSQQFEKEISRLQTLAGGNVVYDELNFSYPAYVLALGYYETSVYALIDEETLTVHYVHVQLTDKWRINFDHSLLPKGYYGFGNVLNADYDVCDYRYQQEIML